MSETPEPDNPLQTRQQLYMLQAFNGFDYTGLESYIVKIAKHHCQGKTTPPKSYQMIVTDFEKRTNYVFRLLHLLPPPVIRSVIRNTLPFDKTRDPDVKKFFDSEMIVKESNPCAGIYVQWVANVAGIMDDPVAIANDGRFFTSKQVREMLKLVKGYIDNGPGSIQMNDTLDRAYDLAFWTTARKRGKSIQGETLAKVEEWIETIEKQYCKNIDPAKADVTFLRTPMEVGWAQNIPSRIKEHNHASQTTALLFLVNAIAKKVFRLPIKEHALLFPIPFEGPASPLYAIAEVLGSILCSSYHNLGGLNAHLAGGSNRITLDGTDNVWYASAYYHDSRLRLGHVVGQVTRLKRHFEFLTATPEELVASRDELAASTDELGSTLKKEHAAMAKYRQLIKSHGQRRREADKAKSERAEAAGEDAIPGASALLAAWERADQKKNISTLLRMCVNAEDEDMADLFSEELAVYDQDIIAEVTQEFEKSKVRNHQITMDNIKRFGDEQEKEWAAK